MLRLGFEALLVMERLPLADPPGGFALADRLVPIQEDLETQATAAKASLRYGLEAGVGTRRDGDGVAEGR